ncbi:MAG: amidohydrolase family protein [Proteobacteria bacterium]|nr:amidohydrolase family protein [Pseudomonadota bacterium]MDA1325921.1 amidohydrolase family protein [Pseudomonadota bacterium]
MAYDLLIEGGTVVDGSGLPGERADVGVTDGVIAAIGDLKGEAARETIGAEGQIVSPGFIDGHTHMDAQIFWDDIGSNSCWHGVTSVVMGNCGFSLAPCAEADKNLVLHNLERAEDISPEAMNAGIDWSWESFAEYFDTIDALPKGLNYAGFVGHSAIRTYAMGKRAMEEEATPDDLAIMKRELEASLRAGALGLSTSRTSSQRTPEGKPVASRLANWDELLTLAGVMKNLGTGIMQIARENVIDDPEKRQQEYDEVKALALDVGVPVTFGNTWYRNSHPDLWRSQVRLIDEIIAGGGSAMMQGTASWNCSLRSFETATPYDYAPVWKEFRTLPLADQEKGLRDADMRKKLVAAVQAHQHSPDPSLPNLYQRPVEWDWVFPYENPLPPYRSVAAVAGERGIEPIDAFIDLALEHHLKLFFIQPSFNQDQKAVIAMMRHPNCVVTFSDAGAHVATTVNPIHGHLLGHWVRNEQAIPLESAIRKITFDIANFWGLRGRGLINEGYHADLTIFDPATISPDMPVLVHDLPAGAPRIIQKTDGISATIVNGAVLMRHNEHTGALPGRLIRGPLARN